MPVGRGPGRAAAPKLVATSVVRPKVKRVMYDVWALWVERHAATPQGAEYLAPFDGASPEALAATLAKTFGTVGALQLHYLAWLKEALAPTLKGWFASTESLENHWVRRVAAKPGSPPRNVRPR
jgi:hypothetical protein